MKDTEIKSPMWVVMAGQGWETIVVNGFPIIAPKEGPHGYIPIFKTREQAVAWNGSEDNVRELIRNEDIKPMSFTK